MKTKIAPYWVMALILSAWLVLDTPMTKAQDNSGGKGPTEPINLSGSNLKAEEIVLKSDAVFVGEITQTSDGPPAAASMHSVGVQVKVLQILKGSVDTEISVTMDVYSIYREGPPQVGSSYIFFAHKEDNRIRVLKLLPATDANVTKVKAAIASTPAGK
jgi:hypothetical protein